jgi:hypothetical protein
VLLEAREDVVDVRVARLVGAHREHQVPHLCVVAQPPVPARAVAGRSVAVRSESLLNL